MKIFQSLLQYVKWWSLTFYLQFSLINIHMDQRNASVNGVTFSVKTVTYFLIKFGIKLWMHLVEMYAFFLLKLCHHHTNKNYEQPPRISWKSFFSVENWPNIFKKDIGLGDQTLSKVFSFEHLDFWSID